MNLREYLRQDFSKYYIIKRELVDLNLLTFNKDSIEINKNFISMGYKNNPTEFTKVFISNYQNWYKNNEPRQYKITSRVLLLLNKSEYNIINKTKTELCTIFDVDKQYLKKTLQDINKTYKDDIIIIAELDKYYINPSIFYNGRLDNSLKEIEKIFK